MATNYNMKAIDNYQEGDGNGSDMIHDTNTICCHHNTKPFKIWFIKIFKRCQFCSKLGGFIKSMVKCKECGIITHSKCMLEEIEKEYNYNLKKKENSRKIDVDDNDGIRHDDNEDLEEVCSLDKDEEIPMHNEDVEEVCSLDKDEEIPMNNEDVEEVCSLDKDEEIPMHNEDVEEVCSLDKDEKIPMNNEDVEEVCSLDKDEEIPMHNEDVEEVCSLDKDEEIPMHNTLNDVSNVNNNSQFNYEKKENLKDVEIDKFSILPENEEININENSSKVDDKNTPILEDSILTEYGHNDEDLINKDEEKSMVEDSIFSENDQTNDDDNSMIIDDKKTPILETHENDKNLNITFNSPVHDNNEGTIEKKIDGKNHKILSKRQQHNIFRQEKWKSLQDQISAFFQMKPNHLVTEKDFGELAKLCGCPYYFRKPLYIDCGGCDNGTIDLNTFLKYWKTVWARCNDVPSKLIRIFSRSYGGKFVSQEHFHTLIQDVIDSHPKLINLRKSKEYHSIYARTVISRFFYEVNSSWSGKIDADEIRNSRLIKEIELLEDDGIIDDIKSSFNYKQFYVIHQQFKSLVCNGDDNMIIKKSVLKERNNYELNPRIIDGLFSGTVVQRKWSKGQLVEYLTYEEFVWFLMAEVDQSHPRSIEYWFRCMDVTGNNVLKYKDIKYYYEEQIRRMNIKNIRPVPNVKELYQFLDTITPTLKREISLNELKRSKVATLFINKLINVNKYIKIMDELQTRESLPSSEIDDRSDWVKFVEKEFNDDEARMDNNNKKKSKKNRRRINYRANKKRSNNNNQRDNVYYNH